MLKREHFFLESDRVLLRPFLEHEIADEGGSEWYTIIDKKGHAIIGSIGMVQRRPEWGNTSLQISILNEEKRGEGYGLEALELLEKYIFDTLAYHRIAVKMPEFNEAAIGFFKKAGYKLEGVEEQGGCRGNWYYDIIRMRLLRNEYVKRSMVSDNGELAKMFCECIEHRI